MPTETDTSQSGWTTETLRQYFATNINDISGHFEARIAQTERLFHDTVSGNDARYAERYEAYRHAINGQRELWQTRLDAMDKATEILAANVNRVPTLLDREMERITVLMNEKFGSVQRQFEERDIRAKAAQQSAETAVNAALSAQKEAVAAQNAGAAAAITKSEVASVKQMDAIVVLMGNSNQSLEGKIANVITMSNASTKSLDDKIDALQRRLDREEGKSAGFASNLSTGLVVVAVVVSLVGVAFNFINSRATPATVIEAPAPVAAPAPAR